MSFAHRKTILGIASVVLLLVSFQPSFSWQQPQGESELQALRREIEALKAGQARIEKQLQELKDLLTALLAPRAAEPREIVLNLDGAAWKGEKTARLILIEFSDYQ
ncbi:MAG: hypothetical protein N0A16_11445 [Blastocatellia bacterium]|nr:hypothetical protein [Blastocatellia bacterium]MCS7158330.1 hypothetical protein [Blastocatellia bacterium]MCX7752836.1 hypothetical protein [Blastocatellia bacterium]MDW8167892.1 hypothetical protein [Acidobacteriota bacterium]MDW8257251.1 hypothetical protein [Acidobacteriota bacterium]